MSTAISVKNLSKKYIIGHQRQESYTALRDVLANGSRRLTQKLLHPFSAQNNGPDHEEFWALKDVSFALAPLGNEEALNVIQKIKALPILKGIRGEKGVSLEVLAEYLARLSLLVHNFPQIEEIDLNPVKGFEENLYVVDGRIIQSKD